MVLSFFTSSSEMPRQWQKIASRAYPRNLHGDIAGVYGPREKDYFLMAQSIKQHVDFAVGFKDRKVNPFMVQVDPLPGDKKPNKNGHNKDWDYMYGNHHEKYDVDDCRLIHLQFRPSPSRSR